MLNYLPAYVQLNIHRLWGESIDKDEQICVPCLIERPCRHDCPGTATETQAAITPILPHLSLHPSQSTLPPLVPVEAPVSKGGRKKHLGRNEEMEKVRI